MTEPSRAGVDPLYAIMREPLADLARARSLLAMADMKRLLETASLAGATSNERVSIGVQVLASQTIVLADAMAWRAAELVPGTKAPPDMFVNMLLEQLRMRVLAEMA